MEVGGGGYVLDAGPKTVESLLGLLCFDFALNAGISGVTPLRCARGCHGRGDLVIELLNTAVDHDRRRREPVHGGMQVDVFLIAGSADIWVLASACRFKLGQQGEYIGRVE
jgi:hypothetical protein